MDAESTPRDLTRSADLAEGDTFIAKKKLRRVSFAETTAVHVFNRDEDYETPPDWKPGAEGSSGPALAIEASGNHGVRTDSDDSRSPPRREGGRGDEEDEDGGDEEHELFVRRDADSSPGSTAGSLTSNDDENLFGPISTSFIRSGRLSDVSDNNNHDITLDSTAFSMHFSNVLPSDDQSINSGISPRTPIGDSMEKDCGGCITTSGEKKKVPDFAFPRSKSSGGTGYSSDMTLVAENSNSYDYGKLPPTLEILLAKVNEVMQPQHPNDHSKSLTSHKYTTENPEDSISEEFHRNIEVVEPTDMFEPHYGENLEVCGNGEYQNRDSTVASTDIVATGMTSHSSCSHNTGPDLPAGSSAGKIKQAVFSPAHKEAQDDIHKAKLSRSTTADASETNIISMQSEEPKTHYSLKWDYMPGSHLTDKIGGNEDYLNSSHMPASDVPAQKANSANQITSDCHEGNTHTPTAIQNGNKYTHSPVESSTSSLCVKRQQFFEDASVSLQTPLSSKRKVILHSEQTSTVKQIVSKFENSETAESIGNKNKTLLSATDCRSHAYKANLIDSEGYKCAECFNISFSEREQVMNISGGVAGMEMNSEMHIHGFETPSNRRKSACDEESRGTTDTMKQTEGMIQVPGSGMRKTEKSLSSENPMQGPSSSSSTFNSSKQEMLEIMENRQVSNAFSKLTSSPMSLLGQRDSASQDQCFTPLAGESFKSNLLLKELRSETPLSHITYSFSETRKLNNQNATPEIGMASQIPWKENVASSSNFYSMSQDRDHKARKDVGSMIERIADRRPVSSLPDAYEKATMINESEKITEHFLTDKSPSRLPDPLGGNDIPRAFHLRSSDCEDCMVNTDADIYRMQSFALLVDYNVGQKRKSEKVPPVGDTFNEPGRTPKTQKAMPVIEANMSEFYPVQQRQDVRDNEALGDITGFLTRIIDGTKEPFPVSINKLNLQELGILEDLVCELQKARKYERLCTDIQTPGKNHGLDHQKSVSEMRSLKETLLYEQAKLQLNTIKRDILLKKALELQSRIHDFSKLRSGYIQMADKQLSLPPGSAPNKTVQGEDARVTSMSKKLESLNEKIKGFVKFFVTSCNVSGDLGHDDIIKVISDNSKKRNRCIALRQHLQLWKLVDVVNQIDQCDIVLNYCNFLSQRFTIKVASASKFSVEVSLNDANIEKSYPNMKSSTAFHFIFNGIEGYKRLANIKCLQKETQATSFILGNLLDVLEEIQLSLIESPNIMSSSFYAQSAGKLELQLCFLDLKRGRKVALSLDVTHLKCAVYPSDPSELKIKVSNSGLASSQLLSDEIMGAVRRLKGGHLVLMQLCRCVSQLIQASEI